MDILNQKKTKELDTQLGKIKVQLPSLKKKLEIERRRAYYTGGFNMFSNEGIELADMFAILDIVMIESPLPKDETDSWDYDEITDEESLKDAYEKVVKWLDSFRKPVGDEQAKMGET